MSNRAPVLLTVKENASDPEAPRPVVSLLEIEDMRRLIAVPAAPSPTVFIV